MTFISTDPQTHNSENTWFTPRDLIEKLGGFDLDPCTVSFRPYNIANINVNYDKGECGLTID